MNAEETKAAAAVMMAWAEGKPIECRYRHSRNARWGPFVGTIVWDWGQYEFRLLQEPVDVEVWVHPDGRIRNRKYWPDSETANYEGFTLRRATIHPESE